MKFELVGKGSSKDLYVCTKYPEHVFFEYSDRVSVFDYGALTDLIPNKGRSLMRSAERFFALFDAAGLATAYDPKLSGELEKCALRRARHPKFPTLGDKGDLEFIPLEVLFRWGAPAGSSLLKRDPGLRPFTRFETPRIEFTTKLESTDRLLTESEATLLIGSDARLEAVKVYATAAAHLLRDRLKEAGLELWDGKIECAWDRAKKQVVLVDALTPDELRVTLPGLESIPLSKELLRQWLGETNWAFRVAQAKKRGGDEWREGLPTPPRLGPWRLARLSRLYEAFAESLEQTSSKPLLDWARKDPVAPSVHVPGEGGREAALRWRLQREGCSIAARPEDADAVFVSQDANLAAGMVDKLEAKGLWTYGPLQAAARLESSKIFGKEIARAAGISIAKSSVNLAELETFSAPPVVKLDGLAAGKGVVVAETFEEARAAAETFLATPDTAIVLEERLHGYEASVFFAVHTGYSGVRVRSLGSAKDFKRRFNADGGPNTGGMGAHAPHPGVSQDDMDLFRTWAQRSAEALAARGEPFNGVMFLGGLKDVHQGWMLLEYNARPGDPETQALVTTWPEGQGVLRQLLKLDVRFETRDVAIEHHAVCVALVNPKYPSAQAEAVPPLPPWEPQGIGKGECVLFRTASRTGRVAYIVGRGEDLLTAGDRAFEALLHSPWKDTLEWRSDVIP